MKNVNIMGAQQFLGEGEGSQKNIYIYIYIYGELPKKGLGQFPKGLAINKGKSVLEGGCYLHAHYDLILLHAGT